MVAEAKFAEEVRIERVVWEYAQHTLAELCLRIRELEEIENEQTKTIKELEAEIVKMQQVLQSYAVKVWNYENPDRAIDISNPPDMSFFIK